MTFHFSSLATPTLTKRLVPNSCRNSQAECMFLLSSLENDNLEDSAACYSWQLKWKGVSTGFQKMQQKNKSQGGGFASIRFLAPCFGSIPVPGTRSRLVLPWVPVGRSPGMSTPYSIDCIQITWKTKEREKNWCQSQKSLQFQLHTRKPTWTDLARCLLFIIHFPLLTWLNKHNSPKSNCDHFPITNLMNFLRFMHFFSMQRKSQELLHENVPDWEIYFFLEQLLCNDTRVEHCFKGLLTLDNLYANFRNDSSYIK